MESFRYQLLSFFLVLTLIFIPVGSTADQLQTPNFIKDTRDENSNLYTFSQDYNSNKDYSLYTDFSFITESSVVEPQVIGKVAIFVLEALVGGMIFEGNKWIVTEIYNNGYKSTINKIIVNVNKYTTQNVPGRSGTISKVTANSSGDILSYTSSTGCVLANGGTIWNCPYNFEGDGINE